MALVVDHAESTLNGAITAGTTSWTLTDASDFPEPDDGDYWVWCWDQGTHPNPKDDANAERARVTDRTGNVLTVVRGEGGHTGVAHSDGDSVALLGDAANLSSNKKYDVTDYGAHPDNAAATNTTAIQAAIDAIERVGNGGTLFFPNIGSGNYQIDAELTITQPMFVKGERARVEQTTTGEAGFQVTSGEVHFKNLRIYGPSSGAIGTDDDCAIRFTGTLGSELEDISVVDCEIHRFRYAGIRADFCQLVKFVHNHIFDIYYSGIHCRSTEDFTINSNLIRTINGSTADNAYGIILTRTDTNDVSVYPRTRSGSVVGNVIEGVSGWEGIDTHSGEEIAIVANKIRDCLMGIAVGDSRNLAGTFVYAAHKITVACNVIESAVTNGTTRYGIVFHGSSPGVASYEDLATGTIVGNSIEGFGDEDQASGYGGGIYIYATRGVSISGNEIKEPSPIGIMLDFHNYGFSITGNTVVNSWSDTDNASGIRVILYPNEGFIGGNTFDKDATEKSATFLFTQGINVNTTASNDIKLGQNVNTGDSIATMLADGGSNCSHIFESDMTVEGDLTVNGDIIGNIGSGGISMTFLEGSKTHAFSSIAGPGEQTTTVTVTGAAVGDYVMVSHDQSIPSDVHLIGIVTAANTVTVKAMNITSGAKSISSGTLSVLVGQS